MNIKTLSLFVMAATATLGAQAQSTDSDADKVAAKQARISAMTRSVAEELQLDADQTQRLAQADEKYAIAMSAMRSITNDRDLIIKKSQELHAEHEKAVQQIVGEENYIKLHEMRKAKSSEGLNKIGSVDPLPTE